MTTDSTTMGEPDASWTHEDYMTAAEAYLNAQDGRPDPTGVGRPGPGLPGRPRGAGRPGGQEPEPSGGHLPHPGKGGRGRCPCPGGASHPDAARGGGTSGRPAPRLGRLWQHVELVELLDEDGEVDPEKVAEAVAALGDSKPYLLKPPPRTPGFAQGRRTLVDSGSGTSWGEVLRGR